MKIRANGIEMNYSIEGAGPWITLSHSLACNLSMWDEQVGVLAKRFKVLRYDIRGHGETDAPGGAYTLDELATDAHALLGALGIRKTHWVGLSLGGMIGQTFALTYPGLFESLALCDTTSRYPAEAGPMWAERIQTVEAKGMGAVVDGTLARWFTEPYRTTRKDVMDRVAAMIKTTPVAGYVGCCHAIPKISVTDRLKEITCPALVVVGDQDAGTPPAMAREIHSALPGSELVIIPSASHLSNIEQPDAFNEALLGFLDRAATTGKDNPAS